MKKQDLCGLQLGSFALLCLSTAEKRLDRE